VIASEIYDGMAVFFAKVRRREVRPFHECPSCGPLYRAIVPLEGKPIIGIAGGRAERLEVRFNPKLGDLDLAEFGSFIVEVRR
jgi:hypothetical protein